MFKKILVATDGSKYAEDAANEALDMAKLNKASLIALYVVDTGKEFAFSDVSANIADEVVQGIKKSLVDSGDKAIKRIAEKAKMAGIAFEGKVVEGHPPTDIIKMAGDIGADLIVMGNIGVTGLEKYLIGSVAETVVRNSKVPVMVVR